MIVHLKGMLVVKSPANVVIDVGGVGYEVLISLSTYDKLPPLNSEVMLLTHYEVREDAQILFGFATEEERGMFKLLLGVSGVGAKTAISFLSGMTVGELKYSISNGDAKRLSSIKGIGKKTAERICVELKDKISAIEAFASAKAQGSDNPQAAVIRDTMLALGSLGFSDDVARKMVQGVLDKDGPHDLSVEEILRKALKQ